MYYYYYLNPRGALPYTPISIDDLVLLCASVQKDEIQVVPPCQFSVLLCWRFFSIFSFFASLLACQSDVETLVHLLSIMVIITFYFFSFLFFLPPFLFLLVTRQGGSLPPCPPPPVGTLVPLPTRTTTYTSTTTHQDHHLYQYHNPPGVQDHYRPDPPLGIEPLSIWTTGLLPGT